jgi:hypothetical protein
LYCSSGGSSMPGDSSTVATAASAVRQSPGLLIRPGCADTGRALNIPYHQCTITRVTAHVGHPRDHRITPWSTADSTGSPVPD